MATGCLVPKKIVIASNKSIKLIQKDFSDLESWNDDDHAAALRSFLNSCDKFAKTQKNKQIGGSIGNITASDFDIVCDIASDVKDMGNKKIRSFFENWFTPFLVAKENGDNTGLFTGYYEASLSGSFKKDTKFRYPIYAKPKNLTQSSTYFSRKEIDGGVLKGKDLELIYVDDKVELFFTHIQGSGRIKMNDGSEIRLAYAGKNNLPFTPISTELLRLGHISRAELNATSIKKWLRKNPSKADNIMQANHSYIFFKISDTNSVIGGQGVPLTKERSLAIDNSFIPYGFPIWLQTELVKKSREKEKYHRLMVGQDTGSAIKGVIRGDIFFGNGSEAEEKANKMASKGRYYVLIPNNLIHKIKRQN